MKKLIVFFLTGVLVSGFVLCSKSEKQTEITPKETLGTMTPQEGAAVSPEQLAAQLAPVLLDLQQKIMAAPADVEIRKALVASAVDTVRKVMHAVGLGKPPENTNNPAMARQFMDRAALIDGYRWIAYLQAWRQHPESPNFGSISGEIPPARLVYMDHPSETEALALVEASLAP
jgi:hypothetical protein